MTNMHVYREREGSGGRVYQSVPGPSSATAELDTLLLGSFASSSSSFSHHPPSVDVF